MKPSNTSASTSTSSGASSSTPAPASHGLRTQLGHLIPKHALFQVHLEIDQLSNVPLIKGEFGVRWKFKGVQSGSGLLGKMKGGNRTLSGQGKGKGRAVGMGEDVGVTEEGELYDEDGSIHGSMHDTTEDDPDADSAESPRSIHNHQAHHAFESLRPPDGHAPRVNGHSTSGRPTDKPAPIVRSASATSVHSRSEARGMTPWAQLQNYNVKWNHSVNVVVQMDVHRDTGDLLPNELKLVVMQVSARSIPLYRMVGAACARLSTTSSLLSRALSPPCSPHPRRAHSGVSSRRCRPAGSIRRGRYRRGAARALVITIAFGMMLDNH